MTNNIIVINSDDPNEYKNNMEVLRDSINKLNKNIYKLNLKLDEINFWMKQTRKFNK